MESRLTKILAYCSESFLQCVLILHLRQLRHENLTKDNTSAVKGLLGRALFSSGLCSQIFFIAMQFEFFCIALLKEAAKLNKINDFDRNINEYNASLKLPAFVNSKLQTYYARLSERYSVKPWVPITFQKNLFARKFDWVSSCTSKTPILDDPNQALKPGESECLDY